MSLQPMIVYANRIDLAGHPDIVNGPVSSRMLLRCLDGEIRVKVNAMELTLQCGCMLLLPWAHTISYFCSKARSCFVDGIHLIPDLAPGMENPIIFRASHAADDALAGSIHRRNGMLKGLEGVIAGRFEPNGRFDRLCQYVIDCFVERVIQEPQARMLAELVIKELKTLTTDKPVRLPPARLLQVEKQVHGNLHRSWSVDELCDVADCSPATLTRLFRMHYQVSPIAWVIHQRLARAAILLSSSGMAIQQVGRQVGIADPYYFSRLFTQHYHQTPRAYRRLHMVI